MVSAEDAVGVLSIVDIRVADAISREQEDMSTVSNLFNDSAAAFLDVGVSFLNLNNFFGLNVLDNEIPVASLPK